MKKFIAPLIFAAVGLLLPLNASAYSREMEQLATELNNQIASSDEIQSITYDGTNLILTMKKKDGQLEEMLADVSDPNEVKPYLLAGLTASGLDKQSLQMFGQILSMFEANLMIRLPLSSGNPLDIVLTPQELMAL